jgi:hypothetical protein
VAFAAVVRGAVALDGAWPGLARCRRAFGARRRGRHGCASCLLAPGTRATSLLPPVLVLLPLLRALAMASLLVEGPAVLLLLLCCCSAGHGCCACLLCAYCWLSALWPWPWSPWPCQSLRYCCVQLLLCYRLLA